METKELKPTDGKHQNSGVAVIDTDTFEVLYLDEEMKRLNAAFRVHEACYRSIGLDGPCIDCPVLRLSDKAIAVGTQFSRSAGTYVDIFAAKIRTDNRRPVAIVCHGSIDDADKMERQMLEQRMLFLMRMSCDVSAELNLDTGGGKCYAGLCKDESNDTAEESFQARLEKELEPEDIPALRQLISLEHLRNKYYTHVGGREFAQMFRVRDSEPLEWLEIRVILLRDNDVPKAFILANRILNENKADNLQQQFSKMEQSWLRDDRYKMIFQQMGIIVFECMPYLGTCYLTPNASDFIMGNFDGRSLIDVFIKDGVIHPKDEDILNDMCHAVLENGKSRSCIIRLKNKNSEFRWCKLSASAITAARGENLRIIGTISDVDQETKLRESLRRKAEYDSVTGIYNRETFLRETETLLRTSEKGPYSLIRMDIDRFKLVNDLFGTGGGDDLLRFIAGCIASKLHDGDEIYSRLRDDVFVLCVCRTDEEIIQLIKELNVEFSAYPLAFKIVLSAGIYRVEHYNGEAVDLLCDWAGLAQKSIKGHFVKRFAFYKEEMRDSMFIEQEIVGDMHEAILEGQFGIYLQPQFDMSTGKPVGAEALVRWFHPTKGIIPPNDFVPLFEKNGFISMVDEYVWEKAAATLRSWLDRGFEPVPISVNVSRVHLYDPRLCEKIISLTKKYHIPPALFQLELTESAYVENAFSLREVMEKLQKHGFTFLMDDFGSGYSSLNMLKNIPVDILKIDLEFLGASENERAGRIILESTIGMAQKLDLPVIAEGVETAEQARFLQSIGCRFAQGYYYDHPMPVKVFEEKFGMAY